MIVTASRSSCRQRNEPQRWIEYRCATRFISRRALCVTADTSDSAKRSAKNLISWTLFYQTAGEKLRQIADFSVVARSLISFTNWRARVSVRAFYSKNALPPSVSSLSDGVFLSSHRHPIVALPQGAFSLRKPFHLTKLWLARARASSFLPRSCGRSPVR